MNSRKMIAWEMDVLVTYCVIHIIITSVLMFCASFMFPFVVNDVKYLFLKYSFVLTFVYNILDYLLYSFLINKIRINKGFKIFVFVWDIIIHSTSFVLFSAVTGFLILEQFANSTNISLWIWLWVVFIIVMFILFLFMRVKALNKTCGPEVF